VKIKLLLVVTGMPDVNGNGGSQFNLAYLNALIQRGIQVTVLHLRSISPKRKLYEEKEINGVRRITVSCYIPLIKKLSKVPFLPVVFRIIMRDKLFDFNIIHGVGGDTVVVSSIMSTNAKIPFILQYIGGDVNVKLSLDLKNRLYVEAINKANMIAFNSRKLESDFFANSGLNLPSRVIYRGVDLNEFSFNFPDTNEMRILFLGGVPSYNEKGAYTMAELCNKILKKPISNIKINIKLGGPNIQRVLTVIDDIEQENMSIQILGAIGRDEVKRHMNESNIVIIPSYSEGMPNVLFEAMATGNIIIATNVGGIPELIKDGVNGFLVDRQSSDDIIKVLEKIQKIVDMRKIAVAARLCVEGYNYEHFVNEYINMYNMCLRNQANINSI
jgi:glycosyltransferase involved in cell wall biosynthesis